MSTHQPVPWSQESESDETAAGPLLRLAEHAIGLWQAAQQVGDPLLVEALRPLVIHVARSLARDVLTGAEDQTAH